MTERSVESNPKLIWIIPVKIKTTAIALPQDEYILPANNPGKNQRREEDTIDPQKPLTTLTKGIVSPKKMHIRNKEIEIII